ncbi:hypothetical protein ACMGE6_07065 [Macrococcus equi]|uniref:hypothetical protein n=1 Tax=Macrococcus equi TaxID=3395462 RepID=UPI0039BE74BB
MKNGWIYIILVAMNMALMLVLMSPAIQENDIYMKVIQVCIVIVTFILVRLYLKDRGFLNK